jgi:hypothetical protein
LGIGANVGAKVGAVVGITVGFEQTSFHVSRHGSHCDQYVFPGMHHMSLGQHVLPVKPCPPHCAYSSFWQFDGGVAGLGPNVGTWLGTGDGASVGTLVGEPSTSDNTGGSENETGPARLLWIRYLMP